MVQKFQPTNQADESKKLINQQKEIMKQQRRISVYFCSRK